MQSRYILIGRFPLQSFFLNINMGESFQDYQDFEGDFPQKVSLKILN